MGVKQVLLQCALINGKDCSVRLILVYGPQENDSEDKNSFYHDISVQVEIAFLNGESIIMVGDLNAKLGHDVIQMTCMLYQMMVNNCSNYAINIT